MGRWYNSGRHNTMEISTHPFPMGMDIDVLDDSDNVSTGTAGSSDTLAISPVKMETVEPTEKRVTMWNRVEMRKISGNAAPKARNVDQYLRRHPDVEVFNGQDLRLSKEEAHLRATTTGRRIPVWNRKEGRIYSGNAA